MRLILIAGVIVYVIYVAAPSFFLNNAVGHETLDAVTERLGQPLHSNLKLDGSLGSLINTYRVGIQPPLCVDYIITFTYRAPGDETRVNPRAVFVSAWTWKLCRLP